MALAFPEPRWLGLAWLVPGAWLAVVAGERRWRLFGLAFVAALVFRLVSLRFLLNMPHAAGAIAGWLALSFYSALYPAAWAWLCGGWLRDGLAKLEWLNLYRTQVGDVGLAHLAKLPRLQHLPIGETRVTDAGMAHIAKLKRLVYLGLRGNKIGDAAMAHLAKLPKLTGLHLGETRLTDKGTRQFAALGQLQKLRDNEPPSAGQAPAGAPKPAPEPSAPAKPSRPCRGNTARPPPRCFGCSRATPANAHSPRGTWAGNRRLKPAAAVGSSRCSPSC